MKPTHFLTMVAGIVATTIGTGPLPPRDAPPRDAPPRDAPPPPPALVVNGGPCPVEAVRRGTRKSRRERRR